MPAQIFVFGNIGADEPIHGVPAGARVRLRLRPDDFAIAYVRTERDTAKHAVCRDEFDRLTLGPLLAVNRRKLEVVQ